MYLSYSHILLGNSFKELIPFSKDPYKLLKTNCFIMGKEILLSGIGSISWRKHLESKMMMSFHNAKTRYWAQINGLPCTKGASTERRGSQLVCKINKIYVKMFFFC